MDKKRTGKAILAAAGAIVLAAGAVQAAAAYQAGKGFSPETAADLQVNQIVFDNKEQQTTKNEKKDGESELWQKDQKAQRQDGLRPQDNANYLFEGQTVADTSSDKKVTLNTGTLAQLQDRSEYNQSGDMVYDIVSDPSRADIIISGEGGDGTGEGIPGMDGEGNGDSGSGNGGTAGTRPSASPAPAATPQPTAAPRPSPRPADTARDPEIPKQYPDDGVAKNNPYNENVKPRDPADENGDNPSVVITKPYFGTAWLYLGQEIPDKNTVYNALETYVMGADGVRYLWGPEALDVYIKIDEVSFDGGNTWTDEFPLKIPSTVPDNIMKIRVYYRLTAQGDWVERIVDYTLERSRVYILSQPITEENATIDPNTVLNDDSNQYPAEGEMLNLLYYQWYYLYNGQNLTSLFPGWEENGTPVEWFYTATIGRHILEPLESVPLDEKYTVELGLQWMSDDYEVGDQYVNLCYLQTLTDYAASETDEDGRRFVEELEVPQYVQAVVLPEDAALTTDYLTVPDTVLFIDGSTNGLRVNKGYKVDENNPVYCARSGVLLNKAMTEIMSIPAEMTRLKIPATVTRVELPAQNRVAVLELEAQTMDEMPKINYSSLASGSKILVNGSLMRDFIQQNRGALDNYGLHIAARETPDTAYTVQNNAVLDKNGKVHWVLDGTRLILTDDMTTLEAGAFAGVDTLTDVVLPLSGKNITLQKGCFENSAVRRVLCYTQEQYDNVTAQLEAAGGQAHAELLSTSREGFVYSINTTQDNAHAVLISVPDGLTEFDGTVTAQDGTAVAITEIADRAFMDQKELVWVTLPESVAKIGAQAFENCTALQGMLIDTKESIDIDNAAIDGCTALRFVASNAMTGNLLDGYSPSVRDDYGYLNDSYLFAPTNAEGYDSNWNSFVEESNVKEYAMVSVGDNSRVLYGLDADGAPWLALRSSSVLPDEPQLPETTVEIFNYAMAQTTTPSSKLTIDWAGLPKLFALDTSSFRDSQLWGDITFGENYLLGDGALCNCFQITSITLPGDSIGLSTNTFSGCKALKTLTLGELNTQSALYAGMMNECDSLTDIYFTGTGIPTISLSNEGWFQFNYGWTTDEEQEKLRLHLPEGTEYSCLKEWRYLFCGYYDASDQTKTAYQNMWDSIQEEMYTENWEFPADEEVDAELEARLLAAENRFRGMTGMELVDEPSDLYPYRVSDDGYITVVSAPRNITEASLYGSDIGLLDNWAVDYIGSTAFARSTKLEMVTIPETMVGIYSGAFAGTESETLSLYFWGETPPQLMDVTPEHPFDFGVPDERLSINAFGNEEAYIAAWVYPMAGYADLDEMRELVTEELTDADGNPPTDEEVDAVINERLLTQENRLRAMMNLDPAENEADMICEHPDEGQIPAAPATPETAQAQPEAMPEPPAAEEVAATPETAVPAQEAEENEQ